MRRVLMHSLLLGVMFALPCCGVVPEEYTSPSEFTATIGSSSSTKTQLAGEAGSSREVLWSKSDVVLVGGAEYTVVVGDGTTTAKLSGTGAQKESGLYKAYYPSSLLSSGKIILPPSHSYVAGRTNNLPMYAQSDTTELQFFNLCAVLNLRLRGEGKVTSIRVETADNNYLSGEMEIQNNGTRWYIEPKSNGSSLSKVATVTCGTGVDIDQNDATDFFIALPAATYTKDNLTVTINGTGSDVFPFVMTNQKAAAVMNPSYIYVVETPAPGLEAILSADDLIMWSDEIGATTWDSVLWNAQRVLAPSIERIHWD